MRLVSAPLELNFQNQMGENMNAWLFQISPTTFSVDGEMALSKFSPIFLLVTFHFINSFTFQFNTLRKKFFIYKTP